MTVMTDVDHSAVPDLNLGLNLDLEPVVESPEEDEVEDLTWGNDPATASWGPMMAEVRLLLHLYYLRETDSKTRSSDPTGGVHRPWCSTSANQIPPPHHHHPT